MAPPDSYIRYSDDIETPPPGESETIADIIATLTSESRKVAAREGRTVRAPHARASAFLKGELRVLDGLPPEHRQGLFAEPGTYPVAVRMAQGPDEHLPDSMSTHRGMAIKVLGASGPKLDGQAEDTRDFVLATGPVVPNPDAAASLSAIKGLEKHAGRHDTLKEVVSNSARQFDRVVVAMTGDHSPLLDFFGHTPRDPLADTYYSQAALRYGDYVAKLQRSADVARPGGARRRADGHIGTARRLPRHHRGIFRPRGRRVRDRVQLCTDLKTMPVEDASVRWPEENVPIARWRGSCCRGRTRSGERGAPS